MKSLIWIVPGVPRRSVGGRSMALADLSYECPPRACLSGTGRTRRPGLVTTVIAPFVAVGKASGDNPLLPWRGGDVVRTVAGVRFALIPLGTVVTFSLGTRVR